MILSGTLLQIQEHLQKILHIHAPKPGVLFQILFVSDHMADIIDGCKRTHAAHHLQIILQPLDSVKMCIRDSGNPYEQSE